jgi:hypothetical protein
MQDGVKGKDTWTLGLELWDSRLWWLAAWHGIYWTEKAVVSFSAFPIVRVRRRNASSGRENKGGLLDHYQTKLIFMTFHSALNRYSVAAL